MAAFSLGSGIVVSGNGERPELKDTTEDSTEDFRTGGCYVTLGLMESSVSVVVPTYNQAKLLIETVDSILAQSLAPAEIVILDDGSSDDTAEVVRRLPSKVKYFYKPNGGICAARNAGAAFVGSKYIAFCDHDDLWRKDKLAKQMDLHHQAPHMEYSFTNFAIVSDGVWASASKFEDAPADFFDGCRSLSTSGLICEDSLYEKLLRFQPIWPSTILITKRLFQKLDGFNEAFGRNPSEDLEFTLRCLQQGPVGIITEPVVGVRKHSTNFSRSNYRNTLGQIEILLYALEHHDISESIRAAVLNQVALRRVDASYSAFELKQFDVCRDLLSKVPRSYITHKVRAKQIISSLPSAISNRLHALLIRH